MSSHTKSIIPAPHGLEYVPPECTYRYPVVALALVEYEDVDDKCEVVEPVFLCQGSFMVANTYERGGYVEPRDEELPPTTGSLTAPDLTRAPAA